MAGETPSTAGKNTLATCVPSTNNTGVLPSAGAVITKLGVLSSVLPPMNTLPCTRPLLSTTSEAIGGAPPPVKETATNALPLGDKLAITVLTNILPLPAALIMLGGTTMLATPDEISPAVSACVKLWLPQLTVTTLPMAAPAVDILMLVLVSSPALMPSLAVSIMGTLTKLANVTLLTVNAPLTPVSSLSIPTASKSSADCAIDSTPPVNETLLNTKLMVLLKLPPAVLSAPEKAASARPNFSPSLMPSASLYKGELIGIGLTLILLKPNNLAIAPSFAATSAALKSLATTSPLKPNFIAPISDNGVMCATTVLILLGPSIM